MEEGNGPKSSPFAMYKLCIEDSLQAHPGTSMSKYNSVPACIYSMHISAGTCSNMTQYYW